ncbi:MAG: DNA recombination protein RmuC [Anaerovoracaceae bacterium]|jgi:DNA recombination protein RmuC|nr:DNA recombination protein RmuC [Anaerovoracaceae bacterium]
MENINQLIVAIILLVFLLAVFIFLLIILIQNSNLRREIQQTRSESLAFTQSQFTDLSMKNEQKLENIRFTLESRISSIQEDQNKRLTEIREIVDEKLQKTLEDRIGQSFKMVSERLEQVYKGLGEMQSLALGVGDLKKVLSNVKTRGILGEVQLGAILEQLLSPEQYRENVATKANSGERVEYAIILPGDQEGKVLLPIDAKFPQEPYIGLIEAYERGNTEEIDQSYKILERAVKTAAKSISDKYIEAPYTTDFGILFLPVEGLYAEVVRRGLSEIVQRDYKVIIAGPTTMAALLNSLQMGFKTLAIQKHSGEVWKVLGAVKTEFDKFGSVLAQTQQRINQANEELDKLVGARTRSIQRKLRGISRLDKDIEEDFLGVSDETYPESVKLFEDIEEYDDKEGGSL